jgi:lysylphosphatidylglycerol synthetase-like protein (DUF2156 family)
MAVLEAHHLAENPSSFLALNEGNSYFTSAGRTGFIAYRAAGEYLVQFGGPFAPAETYPELLRSFLDFAAESGRKVVSVQLQRSDATVYAAHGFTVNQIGASYAIELSRFSLQGTRFMQLRNKISRAIRAGLTIVEASADDWYAMMHRIDDEWLAAKGEHARQLEFLVGQYGGPLQRHRRLFVGLIDSRPVGYISYSPVYGSRRGWMHDLSRRLPGDPPGVMEAINKAAIDCFQAEGVAWLHFGFTPFTGLDGALEVSGYSPAFQQFMHLLWEYGEQVYPARSQLAYKGKWGQTVVLPEYVAFHGPASVTAFAHVFRACNAF